MVAEEAAKEAPKKPLTAEEWDAQAQAALDRAREHEAKAAAPAPPPAAPAKTAPPPPAAPAPPASTSSRYDLVDHLFQLELTVRLPATVKSMAQVEVDLGATHVAVSVDGESYVDVELPRAVDEEQAKAKFAKKVGELRVTAPWA